MNVLLSIKPKYVEEIIKGNKKYEFRKSIFKNENVTKIYIYASSPMKRIVGSFRVGKIVNDSPENLWENYGEYSGIEDEDFFKYFNGKNEGFAIEIQHLNLFSIPIDPNTLFSNFIPPQSFWYFDDTLSENMGVKK